MQKLAYEDGINQQEQSSSADVEILSSPSKLLSGSKSDDELLFGTYADEKTSASVAVLTDMHNMEKAKLNLIAAQEVEAYLMEVNGCKNSNFDPLEWWCMKQNRFPIVTHAARKWLSVSGTSMPSERIFSICGIIDTARIPACLGNQSKTKYFCIRTITNA